MPPLSTCRLTECCGFGTRNSDVGTDASLEGRNTVLPDYMLEFLRRLPQIGVKDLNVPVISYSLVWISQISHLSQRSVSFYQAWLKLTGNIKGFRFLQNFKDQPSGKCTITSLQPPRSISLQFLFRLLHSEILLLMLSCHFSHFLSFQNAYFTLLLLLFSLCWINC